MGGFGEQKVFSYVPGAEKLPEEKELEYDSADNEGWNDVSSEEEDGDVEIIPETEDEQKARIALAQQKSVARIFTDKDFETIRTHEALKEITPSGSKKSRAKKRVYADIDARDNKEIVPLNNIEGVVKCGKTSKAEKLALMLAGREDRDAFGRRQKKMNPFASTTNKQKAKNKPFQMHREKAKKTKSGRSFQEKQRALRDALIKRKKFYK